MTTPIDGRDRYIAIRPLDHFPLIVGGEPHRRGDADRMAPADAESRRRRRHADRALLLLLAANARQIRNRALLAGSEAALRAAEVEAEADRRIKDEYARFGSALDGMGQGLCVFDAAGRVLFSSRGWPRLSSNCRRRFGAWGDPGRPSRLYP